MIRIYRGLLEEDASKAEKGFSFYLEEASLVTLGICYERSGRVLKTMRERAAKFNTDKVKQEDLAGAGGAPDDD